MDNDIESVETLIIGQGPAGLSAAIYTSRAGINTLVLGCDPKVAGEYDIDNYFGFAETITGRELIRRGMVQAKRFGAQIRCERVLSVHQHESGQFMVKTTDEEIMAGTLIIATGVSRVKPPISNLQDYEGKGVSYCVSCDGFFFRGKPVLVAGEGNFAANQALELLNYTPNVRICTMGKPADMAPSFRERLDKAGIQVLEAKIDRLEGDGGLSRVILADGSALEAEGLFVALGEASSLDFAYTLGVVRDGAFIKVDDEMKTNIPGAYAAGDCTGGFLQIAVAVGDGAKAGRAAINYVKNVCRNGGLMPKPM